MKVCLVTGASRGIGSAIAAEFVRNGYSVIINYNRSVLQAERLCDELRKQGDAHLFRGDVSDVAVVGEMFDWVGKYFKHLDVLVNNAGVSLVKQIQDVTEEDYDRVMSVNVKSAFFCCRQALPLLVGAPQAAIVNVASVWGVEGASCESVYSMSKHALVGLTRSLSLEFAPAVSVNCVCPPIVSTEMTARLTQADKQDFCARHNCRIYTADEVARDVFYLATCGKTGEILVEK